MQKNTSLDLRIYIYLSPNTCLYLSLGKQISRCMHTYIYIYISISELHSVHLPPFLSVCLPLCLYLPISIFTFMYGLICSHRFKIYLRLSMAIDIVLGLYLYMYILPRSADVSRRSLNSQIDLHLPLHRSLLILPSRSIYTHRCIYVDIYMY